MRFTTTISGLLTRYPTFGVGHLITESDFEYGCPEGTPVSEERVAEVFESKTSTSQSENVLYYTENGGLIFRMKSRRSWST